VITDEWLVISQGNYFSIRIMLGYGRTISLCDECKRLERVQSLAVIDTSKLWCCNGFITKTFGVIALAILLIGISYSADTRRQKNGNSANRSGPETKPLHLVVRSREEIKEIFFYSPYPSVPSELEGYAGSQMTGIATYRLSVDAQGAVTQVAISKGFTVTAVYDERFSDVKGNAVPALDNVMVQTLTRWRAKPGPTRIVDIYWSFGTHPWVNYGKSNGSE
jgi:hypothetical protein